MEKHGVLSGREYGAHYGTNLARDCKEIRTEAQLCRRMARSLVLPAGLRHQSELANLVAAVKTAGVTGAPTGTLLNVSEAVRALESRLAVLDSLLNGDTCEAGEVVSLARHSRDEMVPAMAAVRQTADALESMVADDLWPLPTYQELLFIR
ncbi:MAG: glutamine synthetase type III, partial [Kiritimatiellae bacterium]|nr:glutamine synthetase type III [Kiritimatiellia bacterium]